MRGLCFRLTIHADRHRDAHVRAAPDTYRDLHANRYRDACPNRHRNVYPNTHTCALRHANRYRDARSPHRQRDAHPLPYPNFSPTLRAHPPARTGVRHVGRILGRGRRVAAGGI